MGGEYVSVWEYLVAPEHTDRFLEAYGPSGEWVRLFRRARGHLRTELLRDRSRPERFVTIDHWESREAWDAFRQACGREYEELDARCAALTTHEARIGELESLP